MLGSCDCAQVRDWNVPKLVCTSTSTGPQQQLSTAAASLIIVALCLGPATSHQPPATSHTPTVSLLAGACGARPLVPRHYAGPPRDHVFTAQQSTAARLWSLDNEGAFGLFP